MLKSVAKVLVRRAKVQARNTAKRTIVNYAGSARSKFDKELVDLLLQHEDIKNENYKYKKRIIELEEKISSIELTLAQTANYFRKCEIDFNIYDANLNESEDEKKMHLLSRRRKAITDPKNVQLEEPKPKPIKFSDQIISKPFNFYSFFIKVSNEDKETLLTHYKVKQLKDIVNSQEQEIKQNKIDLDNYEKEIRNLIRENQTKIEAIQSKIDTALLDAEVIKTNAEHDRDQQIEEMKTEMLKISHQVRLFKDVADQEVKINEAIRYKQRLQIHKLKDDINHLKRTMLIPRLHAQYVEENKKIQDKKKRGEYIPQKDLEFYDISSVRSTPFNKHHSISRNLNEKSRISLPVNEANDLELSMDNEDILALSKLDFIPGQLFKPKTNLERHFELVNELRGSEDKPSILGSYKSVTHLSPNTNHRTDIKAGNLTDRKSTLRHLLNNPLLQTSTRISETSSTKNLIGVGKVRLSTETPPDIFQKKLTFPKTIKQKELFEKKRHNQPLPQLARANKDISDVTQRQYKP